MSKTEKKTEFPKQIWTCLKSPRKGFESIREEDLWKGAVLILLVASFSALAGFNYASKSPLQLPVGLTPGNRQVFPRQAFDTEAFRKSFVILSTVGNGLKVITGWLITAVILHIFARFLAGKGSLKRLMALTGFASIPLVLQQILRLIDSLTISRDTLININVARALGRTLAMRLLTGVLTIFTVFGIWVFALTILAVSFNYESSRRRAATVTLLAYLVFVVMRVFLPI